MSLPLRAVLFAASIVSCIYVARKLRKSQIQVMDTFFWIALAMACILLSVFPGIASVLSVFMGFQAPVNFVFLFMIFILLLRCFLLSIRVSQLEAKITELTQEIAIHEKE